MKIYFGLVLDDPVHPLPEATTGGMHYFGPQGLLHMLESHLGLTGYPADNEYLRIEQYRQALRKYLETNPDAFYRLSFQADQFATATELLSRRDELLLAGWGFAGKKGLPIRLHCLAGIEAEIQKRIKEEQNVVTPLYYGFADRFAEVLNKLDKRRIPLSVIRLNEPLELLPFHFQKLFEKLASRGVAISQLEAPKAEEHSDLARFQKWADNGVNKTEKGRLKADGSLLILKAKRETALAVFLARLFSHNPSFRPLCLIPDNNRALDNAVIQQGLPGMGMLSASLARPTLQVLKLVTVFLWTPIDPFKIMEFVSLAVKPLEEELARRIAVQMAQSPGLNSEGWRIMIRRYFEEIEKKDGKDSLVKPKEIKRQYRFWFERRRYDISKTAPKADVIAIFDYLAKWAGKTFEESGSQNNSLQVLCQQARRIAELLETLPETQLSRLELERIVRTINEPAPIRFHEIEVGHLSYIQHSSAIIGKTASLLWLNFVQNEQDHFFSRWYQDEKTYLEKRAIRLQGPENENALLIWQRKRAVFFTGERLLLTIPEMVDGSEVHPHPLLSELEACFTNIAQITFDIDSEKGIACFEHIFRLPKMVDIVKRQLGKPQAFIHIRPAANLQQREKETLTSLETLFYYPYQWVFRYETKLSKSPILSVVKDATLMGNLAHRFIEQLFKQGIQHQHKEEIENWIEQEANGLLAREGAVLLMYGREPERVSFIKRIKYAAWSLINLIKDNGWEVVATERELEGEFLGIPIKGRADLVLQRGDELAVIDLKWRGAAWRAATIRNEEDLQLVLYSKLLTDDHGWAHTAYFIMENGKMIARNELAFKDISTLGPHSDHLETNERILRRMRATYNWRMDQIGKGQIEIRCEQTQDELEDAYTEQLPDILEMKTGDAPFDDYRALIKMLK